MPEDDRLLIPRFAEKLRSAEAEATGTVKANLNKTSIYRSGKVQCIVDSCLYISIVESGFWNMFLAMIICECSSSLFTFNSDWYFSARLFSNSSEKRLRLCGLKAQSAFNTASLSVK